MIILNTIFPLFVLLFLGSVLKKIKIINSIYLKTSDKLVYFIFFPVMLFWKIGGSTSKEEINIDLCLAAIIAVCSIYILSLLSIKIFKISRFQSGSFSQSCYRFNTYLGMAIVINTLGEQGVLHFGVLIGMVIPLINVLAVTTLIWYSDNDFSFRKRINYLMKALFSNPLIISCVAGIIFSKFDIGFPVFVDNTFSLISSVTLPMALISIGASLSFIGFELNIKVSFLAAFFKLLALPLIGYGLLTMLNVSGVPFKTGMIFFTLPASTAIFVLSSQFNSDTELASSSILLSTLLSFFPLSVALLLQ